jgi:hypothetical protein
MIQMVSDIVSRENQIHQFFLNQKIGSLLKRSNIDVSFRQACVAEKDLLG